MRALVLLTLPGTPGGRRQRQGRGAVRGGGGGAHRDGGLGRGARHPEPGAGGEPGGRGRAQPRGVGESAVGGFGGGGALLRGGAAGGPGAPGGAGVPGGAVPDAGRRGGGGGEPAAVEGDLRGVRRGRRPGVGDRHGRPRGRLARGAAGRRPGPQHGEEGAGRSHRPVCLGLRQAGTPRPAGRLRSPGESPASTGGHGQERRRDGPARGGLGVEGRPPWGGV